MKQINQKYKAYTSRDMIVIEGTARNTNDLLAYAQQQVEECYPDIERVWLVFDKDDFPADRFNNTQSQAESISGTPNYRVAWSNESVELWFLLHFQDYISDNGREQYIERLKNICPTTPKMTKQFFSK